MVVVILVVFAFALASVVAVDEASMLREALIERALAVSDGNDCRVVAAAHMLPTGSDAVGLAASARRRKCDAEDRDDGAH
jgi:hypothetical protein